MSSSQNISYLALQAALDNAQCLMTAAELQGLLVGFYAAGLKVDNSAWREQLFPLLALSDEATEQLVPTLELVNEQLVSMLTANIFGLEMILPDESESMVAQAEALGFWCQGFTQGFLTIKPKKSFDDEDALDALSDVEAVAEIDLDSIEGDAEDEKALFEVAEHIKVATQMLHSIYGQPAVDPKQSLH